jgi:hypothetical protein
MGLDITVTNTHTGASMDMNWLRNPYGLCTWAENNYTYFTEREPPEEKSLWYVINHWNYDTSEQVDKQLFLDVVGKYGNVITKLDYAYFWFDEAGFKQFITPCLKTWFYADQETFDLSGVEGTRRYHFHQREYIGMPMQYFSSPCFGLSDRYRLHAHTLAHYQNWYRELITFAEMLQDPDAVFDCSN